MISNVSFSGANQAYLNKTKNKQSDSSKKVQLGIKNNKNEDKKKPVSGAMSLITGLYLAKKAVTSGLRRALGVRLETHTTSKKNAKEIIKNGCVLSPEFGGNGASKVLGRFTDGSKGFVHITGMSNTAKNDMEKTLKTLLGEELSQQYKEKLNMVFDTPLINSVSNIYRKIQKKMYSAMAALDIKQNVNSMEDFEQIIENNFATKKDTAARLFDMITNRKAKTFYVGGTDKYFNDNFIPDIDDIALKTDKPLKVFKTKTGAILNALKRDGLSGMKQNKSRVAFGAVVAVACGTVAYKFIKSGLNKLGIIKKEEKAETNK